MSSEYREYWVGVQVGKWYVVGLGDRLVMTIDKPPSENGTDVYQYESGVRFGYHLIFAHLGGIYPESPMQGEVNTYGTIKDCVDYLNEFYSGIRLTIVMGYIWVVLKRMRPVMNMLLLLYQLCENILKTKRGILLLNHNDH